MNPVLPLPALIPILVLIVVLGVYLSWRSSHHASKGIRRILILLRSLALIALAIFLLNPGKWVQKTNQKARLYPVLIDTSSSMSVSEKDSTRAQIAQQISNTIHSKAEAKQVSAAFFSFTDTIQKITAEELKKLDPKPTGTHSNIYRAGSSLFTKLQASGDSPEAVILLTDGRQTSLTKDSTLALQARANNAPIYAVAIGSDVLTRDLSVASAINTITAFPKQNLQITAILENKNLKNQSVQLKLVDAAGKQLAIEPLELKKNSKILHTFSIKAPAKSTRYKLVISTAPEEQITSNNTGFVNVRILNTKTRVFIAEGAPYWDSKFLAQLLRQQGHMNVHSVHRLSDKRWFRIDSGQSDPTASSEDVFPDTKEELSHYDLIIFGKNSEHFLTTKRIEVLKSFVRDQGGAVLFSRGKPYSGRIEALETLEPVNWATGNTSAFSILPTSDGQSAGLFGQALPAPNSPIWKSLPDLKDAHNIDSVKPFTRVLAEGSFPNNNGKFPLLLVRRYGQGVTGLVNADGLWKWDFYPEARELGNMYQEFWTQLIQWMVAYSEFLPGHDYSLHASNQTISQDEPVAFSISYRGAKKSTKPTLSIIRQKEKSSSSSSTEEAQILNPASSTPVAGKPTWKSSFVPSEPGNYLVTLKTDDGSPSPSLTIRVKAPPTENDNLNPDPDFLRTLCESTGGKVIEIKDLSSFLDEKFADQTQHTSKAASIWQPHWMKWFSPLIILLILGAEWFLRRRNGLI